MGTTLRESSRGGYRMPAEWEPHEATWLAWPHEISDWPGKFAPIPWIYGEIVRHLSRVENVRILVDNVDVEEKARRILSKCHANMAAVQFFQIKTDRSWTRDFCPIFVKDEMRECRMLNWRFNGWAKYGNAENDDAVTAALSEQLGIRMDSPMWNQKRVVLEGGSIDVNGAGSILTTEECLLSPVQARNPELSREDIQEIFKTHLGAFHTLWLKNGIAGDDTHGHIDDLARFTAIDPIVIAETQTGADENNEPLRENLALLRSMHN